TVVPEYSPATAFSRKPPAGPPVTSPKSYTPSGHSPAGAGGSVAGASVAGISVAGASVAGTSVWAGPQAASTIEARASRLTRVKILRLVFISLLFQICLKYSF